MHQRTPGGVGASPSLRVYFFDDPGRERHLHSHPVVIMMVDSLVDAAETTARVIRNLLVVVSTFVAAIRLVRHIVTQQVVREIVIAVLNSTRPDIECGSLARMSGLAQR